MGIVHVIKSPKEVFASFFIPYSHTPFVDNLLNTNLAYKMVFCTIVHYPTPTLVSPIGPAARCPPLPPAEVIGHGDHGRGAKYRGFRSSEEPIGDRLPDYRRDEGWVREVVRGSEGLGLILMRFLSDSRKMGF